MEFVARWGKHKIWYDAYEIIYDIWVNRQERPLTDKQIELINKHWRILARRLPYKWGVFYETKHYIHI